MLVEVNLMPTFLGFRYAPQIPLKSTSLRHTTPVKIRTFDGQILKDLKGWYTAPQINDENQTERATVE